MYLIFIFIIIFIFINILNKNENFLNYKVCSKNKINKIKKNIFNKWNFKRVNNNWDLYIPCGYTHSDKELDNIYFNNLNNKQYIFAISNCNKLVGKDNLWYYFEKIYGREVSNKYLPNTYILKDFNHMNLFIKKYNKNNLYLLKKNIQRKKGIILTNHIKTILNAKKDGFVIVQNYIKNLFLINKRKINLRLYLLIICQNNKLNWFLNKNGKCIYTNKNYNENIMDKEMHLTSLNLNNNIYLYNPLTLKDLENYIGFSNYKNLFNAIIKIIRKIKIAFKNILCNNNKFKNKISFQLFGLDIIFDNYFKPFLLEINKGPQMNYKLFHDKKLKYKIYYDIFDKVGIKKYKHSENDFIKI